jgi:hypothetical protein
MKHLETSVGFWITIALILGALPLAEAKRLPLINLSCEECHGIRIPLGLEVSDYNPRDILGVFYINDRKKLVSFPLKQLERLTPVYAYSGVNVAYLAMDFEPSLSRAELTVKYLRNGLLMKHNIEDFLVRYNVHIGQYQVIDPETGKPVTQARMVPNKIGKQIIGLKYFELY